MGQVRVVYYSRDGHTRGVAREIAAACGVEAEEIVEWVGRAGSLGYLRSAVEALIGLRPPIRPAHRAVRRSDLLVIGTPIWFWNMSSPVRSYLKTQRASLGRVAFFCTFAGSGQEKVLRDMASLCGRAPVATLALTERQCARAAHRKELADFVRALNRAHVAASATPRKAPGHNRRGGRNRPPAQPLGGHAP